MDQTQDWIDLLRTVELCVDAYIHEEEPGQWLYPAMECLSERLDCLKGTGMLCTTGLQFLAEDEQRIRDGIAQTRALTKG